MRVIPSKSELGHQLAGNWLVFSHYRWGVSGFDFYQATCMVILPVSVHRMGCLHLPEHQPNKPSPSHHHFDGMFTIPGKLMTSFGVNDPYINIHWFIRHLTNYPPVN